MTLSGAQLDYYNRAYPLAVQASKKTGVDPDIIFAQSALETGFGQHAPGNNYFGIKGPGAVYRTDEVVNGAVTSVFQSFRKYRDMAASFAGYADFINKNPRYKSFRSGNSEAAQLEALRKSGYATDPNYVGKLEQIIGQLPGNANPKDISGSIGDAVGSAVNAAKDAVSAPSSILEFLREFFSFRTAGRFVSVFVGILLVGIAIAAFAFSSGDIKSLVQKGTGQ